MLFQLISWIVVTAICITAYFLIRRIEKSGNIEK